MKDGVFPQQERQEGTVSEEEKRKQQAKKGWLLSFVSSAIVSRAPWQSLSTKV